jgi:hypothetical protein
MSAGEAKISRPSVSRGSPRANAADRTRKSVFTRIAEASDSGPQASTELSSSTLDARTLLAQVLAALIAKPANLSELGKRH